MKCEPLRRLLADARQAAEFIDKPLEGGGEIRHKYEARTA
jgi:hypothetical protein